MGAHDSKILQLIADGLNSSEIGKKLGLTKKTIEKYREKLIDKYEANNTANLIAIALRKKIIE